MGFYAKACFGASHGVATPSVSVAFATDTCGCQGDPMQFRRAWVFVSVVALAAFAAGCGNACDDFEDTKRQKNDECGLTLPSGPEGECTDALAEQAECQTVCLENVSCDGLKGDDSNDAAVYFDCVDGCQT